MANQHINAPVHFGLAIPYLSLIKAIFLPDICLNKIINNNGAAIRIAALCLASCSIFSQTQ